MLSKSVNRSSFNANLKLKIQFFASETFNCFVSRVTDAWFSTAVDVLSQTLPHVVSIRACSCVRSWKAWVVK